MYSKSTLQGVSQVPELLWWTASMRGIGMLAHGTLITWCATASLNIAAVARATQSVIS